jgi:hypothetical protein
VIVVLPAVLALEAGLAVEWALAEARTSNELAILSATDARP